MEFDKKEIIDFNGVITNGKQFDIEVKIPEDSRNVVFGIVKDSCGEPISNAVVKLIEVEKKLGKYERKPVSHTFTNEDGEFVFGPLCPDRHYSIDLWVNKVKHVKICHVARHKGECLKGEKIKCDSYDNNEKYDCECPCPLLKEE